MTPPSDRLTDRVQLRTAISIEDANRIAIRDAVGVLADGDWRVVVRYDHDRDAGGVHHIWEEGSHRDAYRDGEKYRVEQVRGPIPASEDFNADEGDLRENAKRYIKRFETWHRV